MTVAELIFTPHISPQLSTTVFGAALTVEVIWGVIQRPIVNEQLLSGRDWTPGEQDYLTLYSDVRITAVIEQFGIIKFEQVL